MAESKEVKLSYPIDIKSDSGGIQKVSSLFFGRLKARHMKLMPKSMFNADSEKAIISPAEMLPLIAALAGISEDDADKIDFEDITKIIEAVTEQMGNLESPETGRN